MVNLELYKIFVIVGNELNITKASEKLDISQPAITKQIKNLESILGTTLFKRSNKGLTFTEVGEILYNKLKGPINEIIKIDIELNQNKSIKIGSHNHLLNIVFGDCINRFCLENANINLDLKCLETDIMLEMLKNNELDIVFSKKVDNFNFKNIKYLELGFLNDIFIASKNSPFANKILCGEDMTNIPIYVPRKYAQTVTRLINISNNKKLDLKNSSYHTILELVSKRKETIGMVTKEYINYNDLEKYNLIELKTKLKLEPISFGIYYNVERTSETNCLIKIIKEYFNKAVG